MSETELRLVEAEDGLRLEGGGQSIRCDLERMLPRLKRSNLAGELLVRAARIKNADRPLRAVDATAGFGEDSLLLAAAGFRVTMFERNPTIAALLRDGLRRAAAVEGLADAVGRMELVEGDSISALRSLDFRPDVVYLDPMFPTKLKNSLTKKKFQLLHGVELPCDEEEELLRAAQDAHPYKIVIKRPLKGAWLGERRPDYCLKGRSVRYDCIFLGEVEE